MQITKNELNEMIKKAVKVKLNEGTASGNVADAVDEMLDKLDCDVASAEMEMDSGILSESEFNRIEKAYLELIKYTKIYQKLYFRYM